MARMNVLLVEDVPALGEAGDIMAVAGGYGRNYLIPRGYAVLATKGAMKQAEEVRQAGLRKRAKERANAESQAEVIKTQKLLFHARAGENDRLYGSVTTGDIAEKLEEAVGFEVDRRRIMLGSAIRDLGIYDLEIRLMPEVSANFTVGVVREDEDWADAEARVAAAEEAARLAEEEAAAAKAAAKEAAAAEKAESTDDGSASTEESADDA